jgi:Putative beta barrel porin-7 (BBP7)
MRRLLAGILGTLMLLGALRADEVEWRAAKPASGSPPSLPVLPAAAEEVAPRESVPSDRPAFAEDMIWKNPAALKRPAAVNHMRPAFTENIARKNAMRLMAFQTLPEPLGPPRKVEPEPKPAEKDIWHYPLGEGLTELGQPCLDMPVDPGRGFYFRGEYLGWFGKRMQAPPLVTTAPTGNASPPTSFGFLGQPGTTVLYGGGPIGEAFHNGGRFTAGLWLDDCQTCGLEGSFFFLGQSVEKFHADSIGFPILTRPIFRANPPNPQESGQLVSFPPGFTFQDGSAVPDVVGAIDIRTATQIWGMEINGRECLCRHEMPCGGGYRIDLFAGFRYLDLRDRLSIQENLVIGANDPLQPPGTTARVEDRFDTFNHFYGAQFGFDSEYRRERLFVELKGSLSLGGTAQVLDIEGSQLITQPGQNPQAFQGGLLALASNIGRHTKGQFSVAPEITLNTGVQLTPAMRVFVGYNFLYWTRVLRAGEQIDRVIDVNQVPNFVPPGTFPPIFPPRPAVFFNQNDFWAQGVQVGMQVRW